MSVRQVETARGRSSHVRVLCMPGLDGHDELRIGCKDDCRDGCLIACQACC